MRVRNFYQSEKDFGQLKGARLSIIPAVRRLYGTDTDLTERIRKESLPVITLLNCVETILVRIRSMDFRETVVDGIWDDLFRIRAKPSMSLSLLRYYDCSYYDYRVNRRCEAAVILGAVYFIMAMEYPEMIDYMDAIRGKGVCDTETAPYFLFFLEEYGKQEGIVAESPASPSQNDQEMNGRTQQSPDKAPDGFVSINAVITATENYFRNDAEKVLDVLSYVVAQESGTDLERIESKKHALSLAHASSILGNPGKTHGMTTGQLALFFYYLFDSMGLNFHNSDKAAWIRLIHSVTGRNADNIKQRLNFRFEDEQTQKDLRYVAGCLKELFPSISSQIDRDSRNQ